MEVEGFKTMTGVRLEMSQHEQENIPHLIKIECGSKALVTMRGRPPLCLRCMRLGHMRGDCPARSKKGAVSVSGERPVERQGPAKAEEGYAGGTESSSFRLEVVRKKKSRKAPEKQDIASYASPSNDRTPAPAVPEKVLVVDQEMEASEASVKRKLEDDDFTPLPRNRVASRNVQVESGG
ncbi:hypothetical protein DPMN_045837 [Dreissena polymorpha]|uniref:CCHC-type domain-containing protein n=1 Tax=Dreissena polymorpha TaxID=45954 RepID=A0A9D4D6U6_DREPO|nr:hypothetical protein DPMN_045837 [Dreissena polymorpha]